MSYSLADHFGYSKLIRFSLPAIAGMIFTSLYTIVDGIFVSNVVGEQAFTALNLIWPVIGILQALGFMVGAGGSALISKMLGEKRNEQANACFSMLVVFDGILGACVALLALLFLPDLARALGADDALMPDCLAYGSVLLSLQGFMYLSASFQSFFMTAAKPKLGLAVTIAGGVMNIVLDYVFMVLFGWEIRGAAWATGLNWVFTGLLPVLYFWKRNDSGLHLVRFAWNFKALKQTCLNGLSEMVTNMSVSLIAVVYNLELMKYIGSAGVVAYGVIQYIAFLFLAVFYGYCMASSPIIAYAYGAGNKEELHSLLHKSVVICALACLGLTLMAEILAPYLAMIFVSYSEDLMNLTTGAIRIYSLNFLFAGLSIFLSSFFTSLNNGPVSALLSLTRTLVLQMAAILILPLWLGVNGIWNAAACAEFFSLLFGIVLLLKYRRRYGY